MIDREARNKLADLMRSLSSGLITNDEFENELPNSGDDAIMEVFSSGAWFLYSDLKEYKLKGKDALSPDERSIVARWVLFLKTDFEYSWPSATFKERLLKVISCGVFGQSTLDKWNKTGDVYFWPFLSNNQLNEAKQKYGYLGI